MGIICVLNNLLHIIYQYTMPPKKYNTQEEKILAHRESSLKYTRKNAKVISEKVLNRYYENREEINARRRVI